MGSRCLEIRLIVVLAFFAVAVPAQDWEAVEMKTVKVAGNVHMLIGQGGNIGVSVGPDGTLIVDDQFAPLADKIRAALGELGGGDPELVLNTHWHGDHTGGNAVFGAQGVIIAHRNVRQRLTVGLEAPGRETPPAPSVALPVVTYDEEEISIFWNGEEIRVIPLPAGHTDGDSLVYFTGSNVLHMGDHFFNGMLPFIDIWSGGNAFGMLDNVERVLEEVPDDVKIIPGHGALATKADLRRFRDMLAASIETVRRGLAEGKSLTELQEAGLPAEYEGWQSSFVTFARMIEFIYRSGMR